MNLLDHPVGWWRDTAQRLLVERQDRRAIPLLKERVRTAANPLGRLHALWTLAGLDALDASTLDRAAHDAASRPPRARPSRVVVLDRRRRQALPIATIIALAADSSIRVRLQAALALGDRGPVDPTAVRALAGLASRDAADPWMRLAILSGLGEIGPAVRPGVVDRCDPEPARRGVARAAPAALGGRGDRRGHAGASRS